MGGAYCKYLDEYGLLVPEVDLAADAVLVVGEPPQQAVPLLLRGGGGGGEGQGDESEEQLHD